jgi:hypothetical protein
MRLKAYSEERNFSVMSLRRAIASGEITGYRLGKKSS